jgi:hypothetical protein
MDYTGKLTLGVSLGEMGAFYVGGAHIDVGSSNSEDQDEANDDEKAMFFVFYRRFGHVFNGTTCCVGCQLGFGKIWVIEVGC